MKKLLILLFSACMLTKCGTTETTKEVAFDSKDVEQAEKQLFNYLEDGKVSEAFALHANTALYKNIVDGQVRNYQEMEKYLADNKAKGIKAYDYSVVRRDFFPINTESVLETIDAERKLVNLKDSILEDKLVVLSILWQKKDSNWKVGYIHSSYKE